MPSQFTTPSPSKTRGRWLVVSLLLFGSVLTLGLYVFTLWQRGPYKNLNVALATEFPELDPRVDGGKQRLHASGPRILRVVLKIPPSRGSAATESEITRRLARLMVARPEIDEFDVVEVHFDRQAQEGAATQHSTTFAVADFKELGHNENRLPAAGK